MENTTILDDTTQSGQLNLSQEIIRFLDETRKWAKFLAILGFIFVGLLVIVAFSIGTLLGSLGQFANMPMPSVLFTVIYLIFALIYFFPVLYLYQFANNMGKAIQMRDNVFLTKAFSGLKSHYKYIGILFLIFISFYALIIIFALLGGAFGG